jgi:peroxiredoxin
MTAKAGSPAVEFALEDTAGTVHRLGHYRGHWLLMVFHRHLG